MNGLHMPLQIVSTSRLETTLLTSEVFYNVMNFLHMPLHVVSTLVAIYCVIYTLLTSYMAVAHSHMLLELLLCESFVSTLIAM